MTAPERDGDLRVIQWSKNGMTFYQMQQFRDGAWAAVPLFHAVGKTLIECGQIDPMEVQNESS